MLPIRLCLFLHTRTHANTHALISSLFTAGVSQEQQALEVWGLVPTPQLTRHTRHFRNSSFCPQKSSAPRGTSLDNRDAAVQIWGAPHCKQSTGEHTGPRRSVDVTCCHGARNELWTSWGWAHLAPGGMGQQERECPGTSPGGIQPTPVLWEMPGTQVRLRARRRVQ